MTPLDEAILAAYASNDLSALVGHYQKAAAATQDPNRAAFYLTHAYVYALEVGHPDADALRAQLEAAGREPPLIPPTPPKR